MIVNAAIQVIPCTEVTEAYAIVDKAIALIQSSGLKYQVGPFETTVEGEYEQVQNLLKQVGDFCYTQKHLQFLVYSKLHLSGGTDILEESKTGKFKHT